MTLSGRWVAAAMRPIAIDEVLEAKMVSGAHNSSSWANNLSLISTFSVAASTTSAEPATAGASSVWVLMRATAAAASSADSRPLATWRSRFFEMVARARSKAGALMSKSETFHPLVANTWAIPLPIAPAPSTLRCFIALKVRLRSYFPRPLSTVQAV